MQIVYLAIGSNVGDSRAYIERAIKLLAKSVSDIVQSSIYTSKAVGYTEQANFLNTVIKGKTNLTPNELLNFNKGIEKTVGRINRFRGGPREIDLDIIFFGDAIIDEPNLHIPHARFAERDFVLLPIMDLNSDLIDPRSKQTISALYTQLPKDMLSILES